MSKSKFARYRAGAVIFVGGSTVAGAAAIGSGWPAALSVEIFVAILVGVFVALGRSSSDVGAVFGSRSDERQRVMRQRSLALAMQVMYVAAFVIVVVTVSLREAYWQADVIGSCGGAAYLVGLRAFGTDAAGETEASTESEA